MQIPVGILLALKGEDSLPLLECEVRNTGRRLAVWVGRTHYSPR